MFDLLFRSGFTVREVELFKLQDAEKQFVSRLALTGAEKKKRNKPNSEAEYESNGDHLLGFKSVKIRKDALDNARTMGGIKMRRQPTYAEERSIFIRDDSVPFNSDLRKYIERKESGTLKLKADVAEPTTEELGAYLAWRDGRSVPAEVDETDIAVASVACVADNSDVDKIT